MLNTVKTNDENNTPLKAAELRKLVKASVERFCKDKFENLVMAHMRSMREMIVNPTRTVVFGGGKLHIEVTVRATENHEVAIALRVNHGEWHRRGTTLNVEASPWNGDDDALKRCQGNAISELAIGWLVDMKLTQEQAQEHIDTLSLLFVFAKVVCEVDPSLALTFIDKPFAEEQKIRAAA